MSGKESLWDAGYTVLETLRICIPTVLEAPFGLVTRAKCDARLASWSRHLVERVGIELDVRGRDAIDWSRSYIVMSNHQSHYDIPVLFVVVPGSMRMVTKKELFRVPIFGKAMLNAGFIKIDRQDRESAIASLRDSAAVIKSGVHVWIAPEGTRSRTGEIGSLKKGGFLLAKETGTAILPVALRGTRDVLPPNTLKMRRGAHVEVIFGTPIAVEDPTVEELMEKMRLFFAEPVEAGPA